MKTFFLIPLTLLMLFANLETKAQTADTTLKRNYEQQTIYLDGSANKYVINNERKKSVCLEKK